jgi:hypothetical protein
MDDQPGEYLSYLLRLWRADGGTVTQSGGEPLWRASLEHSLTGRRVGFASLEDLVEYLQHQTARRRDDSPDDEI